MILFGVASLGRRGIEQDHVRIILRQNWAVALNDVSRTKYLSFMCVYYTRSPFLPGVFCLVFSVNMVSPARQIIHVLGAENAWTLAVSPITSQQQNTDDRDSPALELHSITAVDW